jgi:hypothetical protein
LDKVVTWTTAFRRVHGATRTTQRVRAISRARVFRTRFVRVNERTLSRAVK